MNAMSGLLVTRTRRYWVVALLMLAIYVLYAMLNWMTPIWCDDLDYGDAGHTLKDIFHRETYDYFHANGRIFSHSLVQLFAGMLGKPLFNLFNPLLTLLMVILLPLASGMGWRMDGDKLRQVMVLSVSLLLVWFTLPDQYITMFMIAGSSNYIWAAVLNLLFVVMLRRLLQKDGNIKIEQWIAVCLLSFFAGAWMEMYSVALVPAVFCWLACKRKLMDKKALVSYGLYVVGALVVIFAPGNFVRQEQAVNGRAGISTWMVTQLELAIRFKLIWVWVCAFVLLLVEVLRKKVRLGEFVADNMVWLIGIVVSYAFLFVSGVNSYRSQWAIYLFSIVVLSYLLNKMKTSKWINIALAVVVWTCVVVDFSYEYKAFRGKQAAVKEMLAKAQEKTLVDGQYYLWPNTSTTRKSIPSPTGLNGLWPGNSFATFHHLDGFVIMPERVFPYCAGERRFDSLYCGIVPVVDGMAVMRLEDWASDLALAYEYESDEPYVLRSKPSRLLSALGCETAVRKVYGQGRPLLGSLLEKSYPLESVSRVSDGVEEVFVFDFHNTRYLAAPVNMFRPYYAAPVKNVTIER